MTFELVRGSIERSMSSLYRRYRPSRFTEVIGQDHIKSSLESSLKKGLIAHAYLFSGPRGTGKTSIARLLAKSINCPKRGKKSEACGECEICQEIAAGMAIDIVEIDAASNRGIDEMRELRERINFAPTRCQYRVYIIDEVHMLTKEAFNALLKTLEEPPEHAIFILATTEQHKLPDTIISRCQRYQFYRAPHDELSALLARIAKTEGIPLTADGAALIAQRSDGSYRDALTMLGSVAAHGQELNTEVLRTLLGLPPGETVVGLQQLVCSGRTEDLAKHLRLILTEGYDLSVVMKSLSDRLRDQILNQQTDDGQTKSAARLLEQILLTLSRARVSSDPTGLIVARLLSLAADNEFTAPAPVKELPTTSVTDIRQPKEPASEEDSLTTAVDALGSQATNTEATGEFWPAFLREIKLQNHALYMLVRTAKLLELSKEKLVLAVKFRFYSERLFESKNRRLVEDAASKVGDRPMRLECQVRADLEEPKRSQEDELLTAVVDVFELEEVAS